MDLQLILNFIGKELLSIMTELQILSALSQDEETRQSILEDIDSKEDISVEDYRKYIAMIQEVNKNASDNNDRGFYLKGQAEAYEKLILFIDSTLKEGA